MFAKFSSKDSIITRNHATTRLIFLQITQHHWHHQDLEDIWEVQSRDSYHSLVGTNPLGNGRSLDFTATNTSKSLCLNMSFPSQEATASSCLLMFSWSEVPGMIQTLSESLEPTTPKAGSSTCVSWGKDSENYKQK